MKITSLLGVCITGVVTVGVLAQEPAATFEVASVKPNTSGDFRRGMGPGPGGRFTATNVTLRELMTLAYGIPNAFANLQIVDGPSWVDRDKFDVDARAAGGNATPAQVSPMLRALLVERFKLVARRESRELPVYHLVMDRNDSQLGSRLRRSSIDCEARRAAARARGPAPAAPAGPVAPPDRGTCGIRMAAGRFAGDGITMANLTTSLGPFVGRIVIDRTELAGYFDLDLEWTPEPQTPRPDAPPDVPAAPDAPALFTALREQLGVRLQAARSPIDVVVIDAVEHPTPD